MISPEALLLIGGFVMMLEPLFRGPMSIATSHIAAALREAFPAPLEPAPTFEQLLEQIP